MENGDVILCYRAIHADFVHTGCIDAQLNANAVADGSGVDNTLDNDPFREIDRGTTRSLGVTFNDTEGHRWWLATAKRRIQDTDSSNQEFTLGEANRFIYAYGSTDAEGVGFHDELNHFHPDFANTAKRIINYHGLKRGSIDIDLVKDSFAAGYVGVYMFGIFTSLLVGLEILFL